MTQKAEHRANQEYYDNYGRSDHQNRWIWGALAALALLAGVVWYVSTSRLDTLPAPSASTATEEPTPAPTAPASPATGNQATPQ